jgi:hypothetical protein
MSRRAVILLVAALALGCLFVAACTGGDDKARAAPVSGEEAAEFGAMTLPAGAEVLGASTDGSIDTRYVLALRVNAAQLNELMAASRFTTAVLPTDYGRDRTVVAGPPLSGASDLRYAQDRVDTADNGTVTREVFEDHRSPNEIYVHLFMFTT